MNALRIVIVGCLLFVPAVAWAQTSAIGGVVRDTSGAVLPGVTVEVTSPALIEKVRSAVTDGQGVYLVVDLRPGTYTATFSLPGFSLLERAGIELTAGFTATVNAELAVGTLQETVTVAGAAPIVDTRTVTQRTTLTRTTLDALPTIARTAAFATLLPGATGSTGGFGSADVGGLNGERGAIFGIHGNAPIEINVNVEGLNVTMLAIASSSYNPYAFQEIGLQTTGSSADSFSPGVQVNLVPKDGGNIFSGTAAFSFSHPDLQSENLTDALRARNLIATPSLRKSYDVGAGFGGPIKQDKVWFYTAHRKWVASQYLAGNFFNKVQGTLLYEPDLSRPGFTFDRYRDHQLRLTWQVSAKDKVAGSFNGEDNCNCPLLTDTTIAPEAKIEQYYSPNGKAIVSWSRPATNRLLFEAGSSLTRLAIQTARPSFTGPNDINVRDVGIGIEYGARAASIGTTCCYAVNHDAFLWDERAAVSYITGSHAFKTGVNVRYFHVGHRNHTNIDIIPGARSYTFRNRVPTSVTIFATPFGRRSDSTNIGLFVQDQWTIGKLTVNPGLRYDSANSVARAQSFAAGYFVPARDLPELQDVPDWKNLSPRLGAAYDLFGNGKTAVKASLGRYVLGISSNGNNNLAIDQPILRQALLATRTWNDANRDFIPDCVLGPEVPGANGECGALSDQKFGQESPSVRYADDALRGFQDAQAYSWQGAVSLQHELRPGVAVNVAYFRTWFGNFTVNDNLAVTPADFDPYCITAPVDARLPGGGGNTICGLYDIRPGVFGRVDNLVTQARNFGKQTQVFNGVDVTGSAAFGQGGRLQGGVSTGHTVTDNCYVVDSPQQLYQCHVSPPWSSGTQIKFLAIYPLPWDLRASAVYQNLPGIPIQATYAVTNAEIRRTLGRDLGSCRGAAICNATAPVNLIEPQTVFEDRFQQVDLRVARIFRVGRSTIEGMVDLFNAFNSSPILQTNNTYGARWQNAGQILPGRLLKFGGRVTF